MTDSDKRLRPSETNYETHMAWKKYISKDHPELSKGIQRPFLLMVCNQLADSGSHGQRCFTSDASIGADLELSRDTIAKYKREAIRLGWIENTGQFGPHAAPIYRITIPEHEPRLIESKKTNAGRKSNLKVVPYVKPVRASVTKVDATVDPWLDDHTKVSIPKPRAKTEAQMQDEVLAFAGQPMVTPDTPDETIAKLGIVLLRGVSAFFGVEEAISSHDADKCMCKHCADYRNVVGDDTAWS